MTNEKIPRQSSVSRFTSERQSHWDAVARKRDTWRGMGGWYHYRLEEIYRHLISPGQSVLEIGSGTGDLLAAVKPEKGVGIDFSPEVVRRAAQRHPDLEFILADAHDLTGLQGRFDIIIFSDVVNDLWDVQHVFEQARPLCLVDALLVEPSAKARRVDHRRPRQALHVG